MYYDVPADKKVFLTVPVVLGLSLVACGASSDVAGDDWRTSGVVAGSGTITHDGMLMEMIRKRLNNTLKTVGFNPQFIIITYRSHFLSHVDSAPFRVLF